MCNINVFIKTDEQTEKEVLDLTSFLSNVTTNSYLMNSDGDGFYFSSSDYLTKSPNKINILGFIKEIQDSKFIISHQRIATSGKTEDYLQPFSNEDFVLVHNGILSCFVRGEKSDTYALFLDFNKEFKLGNEKTRELNIVKSLQTLLNNAYGSYSICLYDKKTKNLYYFKNSMTDIHIYRSKDKKEVFITTSKENVDYLDIYGKFGKIDIKDNQIYRFAMEQTKISVNIIANLKKPADYDYFNYQSNYNYGYGTFKKDKQGYTKEMIKKDFNLTDADIKINEDLEKRLNEEAQKELKDCRFIEIKDSASKCFFCNELTHNFDSKSNRFICDECLEEEEDFFQDYECLREEKQFEKTKNSWKNRELDIKEQFIREKERNRGYYCY